MKKKIGVWDYIYLVAGIIGLPIPLYIHFITNDTNLILKSIIASIVSAWMLSRFYRAYRESKENDN